MSIRFEHVFHIYSPKTPIEQIGLNDINVDFSNYDFVVLVGQTGSGKSTLVQHITGLLLPSKGTVYVGDYQITPHKKKNKHIKDIRKEIGLVFQFPEYQLFEDTVLKDVAFGPKNFGIDEKEALDRARKAILAVGLDENYFERSPFELSGGEKRRVAIAGIIAINPSVLILDEPTAGLDPQGSKAMMELFEKIHSQGTKIIMVTHDMDLVLEYASHVIVLKDGQIVKETDPVSLFSSSDYLDLSLDYPSVFDLATKLINKGMNINLNNIKNIPTLIKEIKKAGNKYE